MIFDALRIVLEQSGIIAIQNDHGLIGASSAKDRDRSVKDMRRERRVLSRFQNKFDCCTG